MRAWLLLLVSWFAFVANASAQEFTYDTENAFRLLKEGIDTTLQAEFNYGRGLFDHVWHAIQSGSGMGRGFGPLYSADACIACHVRDGRGMPPDEGIAPLAGFILLIGDQDGVPDPAYGHQLSDKAIEGVLPEASVQTQWLVSDTPLPDGTNVQLRWPQFTLHNLAYGPLAPDSQLFPRLAPQLIGLGLLEQVPVAELEALADPDDDNGDGISGRINWLESADGRVPGRFGWKANITSINEQVQRAAATDMGFTSPLFPNPDFPCTSAEQECLRIAGMQNAPDINPVDFASNNVRHLTVYSQNLQVPPRVDADAPDAVSGAQLFADIGCASCHTPTLQTADGSDIHPYTDLLLHDLGEGLANGPVMGTADAREWRTPPLWGIGRTEQVSHATYFLHDGRARSFLEAILWHGGEAEAARDRFGQLPPEQRQQLLDFLQSL
ncbi:MAG: c-type cytochrome [Hyphomicrobiaceae bacterium]|nr:c-type cytochrome [Hyphomicrobiaceae bacterium]MCC0022890.1 c-type cytochrome [Hyphomicrobiaceae bacterium]